MKINSTGILTARDAISIDFDQAALWAKVIDFNVLGEQELRSKYQLGKDSRDWRVDFAVKDVRKNYSESFVTKISYRLFDERKTYYTGNNRGYQTNPRFDVMKHILNKNNLALAACRQAVDDKWKHVFVSDCLGDDSFVSNRSKERGYFFPLYLYPDEGTLDQTIRVNFDPKLYAQIRKAAGLTGALVAPDGTDAFRTATGDARPDEVKVFDYIYGVLHCPAYRETYREFLKIDFPRVPFPHDPASFADVSTKGEALRRLHLMEPAAIGDTPFPFEGEGDSMVDKPRFEGGPDVGKAWINKDQGFAGVSDTAWNFHIGGYQPAQKWLKDRKGRTLSWDDIRHYQRIIKILDETHRIMQTIELPLD